MEAFKALQIDKRQVLYNVINLIFQKLKDRVFCIFYSPTMQTIIHSNPPATSITVPVIYFDLLESKNEAVSAMSSG